MIKKFVILTAMMSVLTVEKATAQLAPTVTASPAYSKGGCQQTLGQFPTQYGPATLKILNSGFTITVRSGTPDREGPVFGQVTFDGQSIPAAMDSTTSAGVYELRWTSNDPMFLDHIENTKTLLVGPANEKTLRVVRPDSFMIGTSPTFRFSLVGISSKIAVIKKCISDSAVLIKRRFCSQELGSDAEREGCNVDWRLVGGGEKTLIFADVKSIKKLENRKITLWLLFWTGPGNDDVTILNSEIDCSGYSFNAVLSGDFNKQSELTLMESAVDPVVTKPKTVIFNAIDNVCRNHWLSQRVPDPEELGERALADREAKREQRRVFGR